MEREGRWVGEAMMVTEGLVLNYRRRGGAGG